MSDIRLKIEYSTQSAKEIEEILWRLRADSEIKRFVTRARGSLMADFRALSNELSACLHFPYYYRANWDSLEECLQDLEWLFSEEFFLVFDNLDCVMPGQDESFVTFIQILEAAIQAHGRNRWGHQKLRIVVQRNDSNLARIQEELDKTNIQLLPFTLSS